MINASKNDYDLLIVKQFIIQFSDGICVIRHWRIHNYIRADRYKPTMYQDDFRSLVLQENKSYSIIKDNSNVIINKSIPGIPDGSQLDTQASLDKDKLDKDSKGKSRDNCKTDKHQKENKAQEADHENKFKSKDSSVKPQDKIIKKAQVANEENIKKVIEEWNQLHLCKILSIKNNRLKLINARINEYGIDKVLEAIKSIHKSSFLKGCNERKWKATFDWFIKPSNFIKVLEGNYIDANDTDNSGEQKFSNFKSRDYDFDSLEKKLLGWDKK